VGAFLSDNPCEIRCGKDRFSAKDCAKLNENAGRGSYKQKSAPTWRAFRFVVSRWI
jgi:hypothetical protein